MHWFWTIPLGATLLAAVALVRILGALRREADALVTQAAELVPIAEAIGAAADRLRATGTTIAGAARRYTPRHG
jgi:hypothetical protein